VTPEEVIAALVGAGAAMWCSALGFGFGWLQRDKKAAITEDRWIAAVARAREERDDAQAALTALLEETEEWRTEATQHDRPSSSPDDESA
jgi:hypothetical protein